LQNLGAVQLELGNFGEARATFEAALALPGGEERRRRITHNLATTELRDGHPELAAALLDAESRREDPFPESLLIRAKALAALGRTDEAVALARRIAGQARK
jgi:Tfp pilus assembly protein PilF